MLIFIVDTEPKFLTQHDLKSNVEGEEQEVNTEESAGGTLTSVASPSFW